MNTIAASASAAPFPADRATAEKMAPIVIKPNSQRNEIRGNSRLGRTGSADAVREVGWLGESDSGGVIVMGAARCLVCRGAIVLASRQYIALRPTTCAATDRPLSRESKITDILRIWTRLPIPQSPLDTTPLMLSKRHFAAIAAPLVAILLVVGSLCAIPTPAIGQDVADATGGQTIAYWVEQLASDQYLRRESAAKRLVQVGPDAIDDLVLVLGSGELEVVERAVAIITEIAVSRPPSNDGGAWQKLNELSSGSAGRTASRTESAIEEIRELRATQARTELAKSGIFVGMDEFVIRAISRPMVLVQIDEKWRGNAESLQWLAWLNGVENARIKGPAVTKEVLAAVAKVPGLKSLAIVDGTVSDEALDPLLEMEPLNALEFRYVKLTDQQGDKIASMPIRVSLNLMGTGISAGRVDSMRSAAPGLQIDHRQGGFLGVTCLDGFDVCEISGVVPGSAAEEAGLIKGDIVTALDDTEVTRFKDLQDAINQHVPGDEVTIKFMRGDSKQTTSLKLRRFEEP